MPFAHKDPRLLRAALFCLVLGLIPLGALIALNGCASAAAYDPSKPFLVATQGTTGHSNDPVKFAKPLVAIRKPYAALAVGDYVLRYDRIGFGTRYVLHQLVEKLPDGTWRMQGHNRVTNPNPDQELLTKENYIGVAYPLLTE